MLHALGQLRLAAPSPGTAYEPQVLISKGTLAAQAQAQPELRVIAPHGMGIQWQVVGQQVDIVGNQPGDPLSKPTREPTVLTSPEQPMVHQDRIGTLSNRRLNQLQTGGNTSDQSLNDVTPLHLQAIRPIILEALHAQKAAQILFNFALLGHMCILWWVRTPHWSAEHQMRRVWLIFSQAVTVAVAVLFVLVTLKPHWLGPNGLWSRYSVVNAAADGALPATGSLSAAAQAALPAVVSVSATRSPRPNPHAQDPAFRFFFGDRTDQEPPAGIGSGVIVSPQGYVLTNHHVIEGAQEVWVQLADGRQTAARVVGTDPDTDIAVLRVDLPRLPVVALGETSRLRVGDAVLAIGNPFNVGQTVTAGIVSALGRSQLGLSTFENFIQTDAAINPGNSGGALVDIRGALVGINTAIYSHSGGSMGIGFAVPVELAREVMDALIEHGRVIRGWIGVEPRDLTPELSEALGITARRGVLIAGVLQDGPAGASGLQPGDLVTAVGSVTVNSTAELLRTVAALRPKTQVSLAIVRRGQDLRVTLTVAQRPAPTTSAR